MRISGVGTYAVTTQVEKTEPADRAMPPELSETLDRFRVWGLANRDDARRESWQFWMLKVPAILTAAGSSALTYFNLKGTAVVAGALAAFCVLMDSLNPKGALRNAHWRAYNEISKLVSDMDQAWKVAALQGKTKDPDAARAEAAKILESHQPEVDRINRYIVDVESALSGKVGQ